MSLVTIASVLDQPVNLFQLNSLNSSKVTHHIHHFNDQSGVARLLFVGAHCKSMWSSGVARPDVLPGQSAMLILCKLYAQHTHDHLHNMSINIVFQQYIPIC